MLFSWTVFCHNNKEISFKSCIGTKTGTLIHVMLLEYEDIISYSRNSNNVIGIGCPFTQNEFSRLFSWKVYGYKKIMSQGQYLLNATLVQ